jgi:16S rRNA (guanine1207-N2)-methyltransferase
VRSVDRKEARKTPVSVPGGQGEYLVEVSGRKFRFLTQPGIFSMDSADSGTMLLLDCVTGHIRPHAKILDLGTGVGIIGTVLAPLVPRGEVWMVDVDIRATRLAQQNLERNKIVNSHVVLGDTTMDLPKSLRFDFVVSNPPTHDGREVLQRFVNESYRVLRPGGWLWIVVNRLLSIQGVMAETFGAAEIVKRKSGFIVLRSQKQRRQKSLQHSD